MGFLNTNSMPMLVEKLADGDNIKITGNSKGNRVGTVVKKIVEKADDVTKAIEQEVINDGYSFKVGTGDVDVSTDVEDGFGEVGIKGVTYQNVLPVGMFDSKENFYALGGQVSDLHSSFDGGYITLNATGSYGNAFVKLEKTLLKQNSKYTLILDIKNTNLTLKEEVDPTTPSFAVASAHSSEAFVEWCFLGGNEYPLKNGIQKFLLTTKSDFTGVNWSTRMFISDKVASGSITFRFLLLEGDHTNNPNLPSYFEGIVGVGDKSKNLFREYYDLIEVKSGQKLYLSSAETTNGERIGIKCFATDKVTMDLDIISPNSFYKQPNRWLLVNNQNKLSCAITVNKDGFIAFDDFLTTSQSYKRFNDIQLQEGSTATAYEPYYDGHKIEILSNGKNLFKPDIVTDTKSYTLHTGNGYWGTVFKVKPNTDYRITSKSDGFNLTTIAQSYVYFIGNGGGECWIVHQTSNPSGDSEGIVNSGSKGEIYIRMPEYTFPIIPYMLIHRKIQIEEGTTGTTYTPYIEDKTQILLDEPLMRLPNGTYDEITRDGKLIRRVGKIVFDGSEDWRKYSLNTNEHNTTNKTSVFYVQINDKSVGYNTSICDRFANTKNSDAFAMSAVKHGLYTDHINLPNLYFDYGENNSYSVTNFKEWLSQNPTTVYYELSTPIITELPAPYLRIFKDGHLTFNTLVAPESSHVVQLNKSAQIERSIREVQGLDSRVGQLESFYDDMMLETNHKLSLLNYDFEYTRERNGE